MPRRNANFVKLERLCGLARTTILACAGGLRGTSCAQPLRTTSAHNHAHNHATLSAQSAHNLSAQPCAQPLRTTHPAQPRRLVLILILIPQDTDHMPAQQHNVRSAKGYARPPALSDLQGGDANP